MIQILKYLKYSNDMKISLSESEFPISKDEVKELVEMGVLRLLYGGSIDDDEFMIAKWEIPKKIMEYVLDMPGKISRKQLLCDFDLQEYYVNKLLKEGKLIRVEKGVYEVNKVDIKKKNIKSAQKLTVTDKLMKAIEQENLDKALSILEETKGEELLELSKNLWKWLLPKIVKKEVSISDSDSLDEQITVEETSPVTIEDVCVLDSSLEEKGVVSNDSSTEMTQSKGISLEELLKLFYLNLKSDPLVAKEYLMQYKRMCEKKKIEFNYYLLGKVNQSIANLGVSPEQIAREKKLLFKIKLLLESSPTVDEFNEIMNEFDSLYKNRGVLSNLYHGFYEKSRDNHVLAASYFEKVLEVEPWNQAALNNLVNSLYYTKDYHSSLKAYKQLLKYYPKTSNWLGRYTVAKTYIALPSKKRYEKARKIFDFEGDIKYQKYKEEYLKRLIGKMEKLLKYQIERLEENVRAKEVFFSVKKIQLIIENLEYYKEMLNYFQISPEEIEKAMQEDEGMMTYVSDIIDFMNCDSSGFINFSNVEFHINELDIEEDERLLYYLAAARIFLINHFPKQAEYYLKLVRNTKEKSKKIKEQYQQLERNKTLYLNMNK